MIKFFGTIVILFSMNSCLCVENLESANSRELTRKSPARQLRIQTPANKLPAKVRIQQRRNPYPVLGIDERIEIFSNFILLKIKGIMCCRAQRN